MEADTTSRRRSRKWVLVVGLAVLVCGAGALVGTLVLAALSGAWGPGVGTGDAVAIVRIEGILVSGSTLTSYTRGAFSEGVIRQLERAESDTSVKAIVLRINSPGGSAVASNEVYEKLLGIDKPIVASMGEVAASGGYYVACAADKIVANPASMTGSIGVISQILDLEELLGKVGVEVVVIKSGAYKDVGSFHRQITDEERALFQAMSDEVYDSFVRIVAQGRELPEGRVRELADGRIYTGSQAEQLGLVDELGNLPRAIELAAEMGDVEGKPRLIEYRRREPSLLDLLFGMVSPARPYASILELIELGALPSLQFRYVGP